ncbi:uncharacterized protein LOC141630115 [Silene latifolia]|uniref:uncharacterized protein LOC141630115 n=1 Tax=Silene latifolia TaxID=37657 RepID=UPI003D774717
MNLLSLNCRGLGNPDAVGGLKHLLRREDPSIVLFCETKLCSRDMQAVIRKIGGYEGVAVDSRGRSGVLAFFWRKEVRCQLRLASVHVMDFDVEFGEMKCRITSFYGWPAIQDRHLSWQQLRLLATQSNDPWLCVGDFNEILYSTEMRGGNRAQRQMNNFRDVVDDCGLRDIPFEGYEFTFDNGQAGIDNRQCRLDRAMGTTDWFDLFPYAKLLHLDREWSDHSPLRVVIDKRVREGMGANRKFRFEHGINIGGITRDLAKKRRRLKILNEGQCSKRAVEERRKLVSDINKLLRQEEQFWRQRSRAIWFKDGDCKTKFFRRTASQRKEKNRIQRLVEEDGHVYEKTSDIAEAATRYFQGLFSSTSPIGFDDVLQGVEGSVTGQMNEILRAVYTGKEVIMALNQMNPLKAPGPDDGLFFQTGIS